MERGTVNGEQSTERRTERRTEHKAWGPVIGEPGNWAKGSRPRSGSRFRRFGLSRVLASADTSFKRCSFQRSVDCSLFNVPSFHSTFNVQRSVVPFLVLHS